MAFWVCVALEGIPIPDRGSAHPRADVSKLESYAIMLGDTVEVRDDKGGVELTSKASKDTEKVTFDMNPDEEEEDPREKQESGREETRRRHQEEPRRRGRLDLSARPPHSAHAAHGAACAKPVPTAYTAHPRGAHTNHKILKSESSLDTQPTSRLPTARLINLRTI